MHLDSGCMYNELITISSGHLASSLNKIEILLVYTTQFE